MRESAFRAISSAAAFGALVVVLAGCSAAPGAAGPGGGGTDGGPNDGSIGSSIGGTIDGTDGGTDDGSNSSLDGSWLLTSALDSKGTIPLTDAFITLRIGEGAGASQGPCNSYTVSISGYGDNVAVENVLATQRACENPTLTKVESRYFADLAAVTSGRVVGGELKLTGPDGLNLTFVLPRK
jgi:heat shock protein HslJ